MNALILSCGTGGGEMTAAGAVKESLESHGHRVTLLDLYSIEDANMGVLLWRLRRAPADDAGGDRNGYRVQQYLSEHSFDVVILTHALPAVILSMLRNGHTQLPPLIYVAADYICAPFVEDTCCDCYVIPSEKLTAEFCRRGIPKEKILPAGIPVRREFLTGKSRAEAREEAGMEPDGYYILLSAEKLPRRKLPGAILGIRKYLDRHPKTRLVVAGMDGGDRKRLKPGFRYDSRIELAGEQCRLAVYLRACDILVSGACGVTATEAAVLGVPLIQLWPSGSSERRSAEFFSRYGMSIVVRGPGRGLSRALERLSETSVRQEMIRAQQTHISRLAAAEISNLAESSTMAVEAGSVSLLV